MIRKTEGILTAITPIHHGGNEKTGSTPTLRTIMLYNEELGEEIPVPYINGNGIRGKLRRLLMRDYFHWLDWSVEELPVKLYHILFSGGILESTEDTNAKINLELRRQIRETIPPLSLFGAAVGNQMIQGKLKVGHAFPLCREYLPYLPEVFRGDPRTARTVRIFTDEAFDTRKDDLKAARGENEQAIQMKVEFECFIPGTAFYHWFSVDYATAVELACLGRLLKLWEETPFVGGKASSGYGQVNLDYRGDLPNQQAYFDYLQDNREAARGALETLGGTL